MRVLRLFPELLLLPFIIHRLGAESYGIYVLAWSVLPLLVLVQQGIGSAIIKYTAAFFGQGKLEDVNKVLSTSSLLSIIVGIASGLCIIVVANCAPWYFEKIGQGNTEAIIFVLNTVGIMVLLSFPLMPYAGILQSLQRYDLIALVTTAFAYARVGAVVCWFLFVGPSIKAFVIVSAVLQVLSGLCLTIIAYRLVPGLRNRLRLCNWNTVKMMFEFSTVILLCSLCSVINTSGVKWMMGTLVSLEFVGMMAVMLVLASLLGEIVQAMSLSVMPAASKYFARNDHKLLEELFVRGTRYMTLLVIVSMMAILLITKPFFKVWMGAEYQYLSIYVIILCAGTGIFMSAMCAHRILVGTGMLKASLICSVVGPVFVTMGTIFLILLRSGSAYWAVTLGLTCGYVVTAVMRVAFCAKGMGVSIKKLLWRGYVEPMVTAAPIMIIALAAVHYWRANSLALRAAASAVTILAFAYVFGLIFLTEQERRQAKTIFQLVSLRVRGMLSPNG